jgi:hypothetical protein
VAKKQAAKKPASKELEDRIVELRRVRAGDLLPNPENWRTHGDDQMAALDGILGEVGIADAVLAFPADGLGPDGDSSKLMLFDGHARTERDPDQLWPVIVTDLTLDEARKMLAVTDPLAAMAGANEARLNELLANVSTESEALLAMLDGLMAADEESELVDDPTPPEDFKEVDENIETEHSCPKCGYKWSGGK